MTRRIDIFLAIIEAWKAKDIDLVLSHMDDEIVWHSRRSRRQATAEGQAVSARKFLTRFFGGQIHDIRWRVFHHAEVGDRLFVEGVDEYITDAGVTVAAPYAGVIEFRGDLVVGWRLRRRLGDRQTDGGRAPSPIR